MVDTTHMSDGSRRTLLAMHASPVWMTFAEIGGGVSAVALTLMATRSDPWVQRRRAHWGGEPGQNHGTGYEYQLTARGREYRDAVVAERDADMAELVRLRVVGDDDLEQGIASFSRTYGVDAGDIERDVDTAAEPRLEALQFERDALDVG